MDQTTGDPEFADELRRAGLSAEEAGAALAAAVPAGWLLPYDLPTRALRAVPDGAGTAGFAAALDRELAPLRAHLARHGPPGGPGAR